MLAALLIVGSFALQPRRPLWGGFLSAVSVFVRPSNVLYLPLVLLAWPGSMKSKRLIPGLAGAAAGLLLFCSFNYCLFGHPLLTSHDRLVAFLNGELLYAQKPFEFSGAAKLSLDVFQNSWYEKLLSFDRGLLPFNPVFFLSPLLLPLFVHGRNLRVHAFCLGALLTQGLVVFSYEVWHANGIGNRYLFPAIILFLFPIQESLFALNTVRKNAAAAKEH